MIWLCSGSICSRHKWQRSQFSTCTSLTLNIENSRFSLKLSHFLYLILWCISWPQYIYYTRNATFRDNLLLLCFVGNLKTFIHFDNEPGSPHISRSFQSREKVVALSFSTFLLFQGLMSSLSYVQQSMIHVTMLHPGYGTPVPIGRVGRGGHILCQQGFRGVGGATRSKARVHWAQARVHPQSLAGGSQE